MEKKKQESSKAIPKQLDLFQQNEPSNSACCNTYKLEYIAGATVIAMASYTTKQQIDNFYNVVRNLTAHLD